MSLLRAVPKPLPRPKKRKPLRRKPARRLSRLGSDPGRLEFCRAFPCVMNSLVCDGPIEASHDRNMTGLGRKEADDRTVPMCRKHHQDWEQHKGWCEGWTKEFRKERIAHWIRSVNRAWRSTSDVSKQWW